MEPDWNRASAIMAEVEQLQARGAWTEAEFHRLLAELREAIGTAGEGTEMILLYAEPEWLERLPPRR
ncbi:MAG: hypothetical protein HY898_22785 [Deltaproteobacteria bacterium]|nr:hypothetical protein [Deltaproteobacteria bacterium]